MKHPKTETEVKHSQSKKAWNVIGTIPGRKYKIARVPYFHDKRYPEISTKNKAEALEHAEFISWCFNHPDKINL